jgi:hypothetical protein
MRETGFAAQRGGLDAHRRTSLVVVRARKASRQRRSTARLALGSVCTAVLFALKYQNEGEQTSEPVAEEERWRRFSGAFSGGSELDGDEPVGHILSRHHRDGSGRALILRSGS